MRRVKQTHQVLYISTYCITVTIAQAQLLFAGVTVSEKQGRGGAEPEMALKERAGSAYNWAPTYHGSGGGRLVDLVLRGLDLGLQVCRRVEVLALVA